MAPKKEEEDDDDISDIVSDEGAEEENEEESNDLNKADIVTKYRCAGDIANAVMAQVLAAIKPGAKCVELCALGDSLVEEATAKIYNKKAEGGKKVEKGSAFPTCISVNHCVGHYSPLVSEDKVVLEEGARYGIEGRGILRTLPCADVAEACRKGGDDSDHIDVPETFFGGISFFEGA